MHLLSKRIFIALTIALATLLAGGSQFFMTPPVAAQEGTTAVEKRPFQLPFTEPPGPDTWLMAQPYGNTTGAYRQRFTTYGASGGIHFGVDLSAPCGTEVVAIADGVVFAVDGPFGSPPHNLMIDHPQLGYASLYGHLLVAPNLTPGQRVKQGQVIAQTGDSQETCYGRPHLHLEIRNLAHIRKYNPVLLIDANWDNLALVGSSGRDFARDLDEPRKWQSLYDQPEVQTGGPIVNDFAKPWPPDWEKNFRPSRSSPTPASLTIQTAAPTAGSPALAPPAGRQLTTGNCCTNPAWSPDSTQVRFIDQPTRAVPLGLWGVDVTQSLPRAELLTTWLGLYSPDETLIAYPDSASSMTVIERLADGQTWQIDTQKERPGFTPDSRHLMWTVSDDDAPRDTRLETVWLANVDGSDARVIWSARRTNIVGWLADDTLLLSRRVPGSSDETLLTLSLANGRQTELLTLAQPRGLALSPDRRYLVYYVTFEADPAKNGLWLLDLEAPTLSPQKLPFFGAYRWRDQERLIYVPFEPAATGHNFYEYNVTSGQSRALFPNGANLTIANNDWRVSPDGRRIALVAAGGTELDGIWVLDID
jgi:hypothetical protein